MAAEPPLAQPTAANPQSTASILLDADTGAVLLQRDCHARLPMASTTKIMSALLAIESGRGQEWVTISPRAAQEDSRKLGLEPGMRFRLDDLIVAMLLDSANDAAEAVAEHLGGEAFIARMNRRAAALGCRDTHFVNPHGLYDPNHYSSAYDLALMARAALRHPRFRQLVACREAEIAWPDGSRRALSSHNKLLWTVPGADGVKTGYVRQSGRCLVGSVCRGGWRLISVVLNSPDMWEGSRQLLEWGFANHRRLLFAAAGRQAGWLPLQGADRTGLPLLAARNLSVVVGRPYGDRNPAPAGAGYRVRTTLLEPALPIRAGRALGRLELLRGGRTIASTSLVAGEPANPSLASVLWGRFKLACMIVLVIGAVWHGRGTVAKAAGPGRGRLSPAG